MESLSEQVSLATQAFSPNVFTGISNFKLETLNPKSNLNIEALQFPVSSFNCSSTGSAAAWSTSRLLLLMLMLMLLMLLLLTMALPLRFDGAKSPCVYLLLYAHLDAGERISLLGIQTGFR
jgi:hypothetical protein